MCYCIPTLQYKHHYVAGYLLVIIIIIITRDKTMISMKYIHFHIGMCTTTSWVFKNDDTVDPQLSEPHLSEIRTPFLGNYNCSGSTAHELDSIDSVVIHTYYHPLIVCHTSPTWGLAPLVMITILTYLRPFLTHCSFMS